MKTVIDDERKKNAIDHHARLAASRRASATRGGPCPDANDLCTEIAAAGVLDAFAQNRLASFEDIVQIELYARARG